MFLFNRSPNYTILIARACLFQDAVENINSNRIYHRRCTRRASRPSRASWTYRRHHRRRRRPKNTKTRRRWWATNRRRPRPTVTVRNAVGSTRRRISSPTVTTTDPANAITRYRRRRWTVSTRPRSTAAGTAVLRPAAMTAAAKTRAIVTIVVRTNNNSTRKRAPPIRYVFVITAA